MYLLTMNFYKKNPLPNGKGSRHLSMRTAGSHNCSRSAPALQLNVDLLSIDLVYHERPQAVKRLVLDFLLNNLKEIEQS